MLQDQATYSLYERLKSSQPPLSSSVGACQGVGGARVSDDGARVSDGGVSVPVREIFM